MTSSNPNYLLKAPPPNAIMFWGRVSTHEFGGTQTFSPWLCMRSLAFTRRKMKSHWPPPAEGWQDMTHGLAAPLGPHGSTQSLGSLGGAIGTRPAGTQREAMVVRASAGETEMLTEWMILDLFSRSPRSVLPGWGWEAERERSNWHGGLCRELLEEGVAISETEKPWEGGQAPLRPVTPQLSVRSPCPSSCTIIISSQASLPASGSQRQGLCPLSPCGWCHSQGLEKQSNPQCLWKK